MTENEKRYDIEYDGNCYKCIVDCEKKVLYTDRKQIVDLLNDQNELIQQGFEELAKANDEKFDYEMKVKDILKKYYNLNRGLKLEKIFIELANELGVELK